jgi:hypothetical protein
MFDRRIIFPNRELNVPGGHNVVLHADSRQIVDAKRKSAVLLKGCSLWPRRLCICSEQFGQIHPGRAELIASDKHLWGFHKRKERRKMVMR